MGIVDSIDVIGISRLQIENAQFDCLRYCLYLGSLRIIKEFVFSSSSGTILCRLTLAIHLSSLTWTLTLAVISLGFNVMHPVTVAQRYNFDFAFS